jgi:hypothetical protein
MLITYSKMFLFLFTEDAKAPVRKQSIKIGRSDSAQNLIRKLSYLLSRPTNIVLKSIKIGRSDSAQNLITQLSYLLSRPTNIVQNSIKIGRSDSAQNLIRQLSYLLSRPTTFVYSAMWQSALFSSVLELYVHSYINWLGTTWAILDAK